MNQFWPLILIAIMSSPAFSQTVVNAASGAPVVAPGSIISIYGASPIQSTGQASSLPLPTYAGLIYLLLPPGTPSSTRVSFFYWSPSQTNALLPFQAPTGTTKLYFRDAGAPGGNDAPAGSVVANIQAQAPGVFVNPLADCSISSDGCAQRVMRAILTDAKYALILSTNPARTDQGIVVWCTGLGVSPTAPEVTILPAAGPPVNAQVFYSGHTSEPGLDQVNFIVPTGAALSSPCVVGSHLELPISLKSVISGVQSNVLSLPVTVDSCN